VPNLDSSSSASNFNQSENNLQQPIQKSQHKTEIEIIPVHVPQVLNKFTTRVSK
jgi:hypothetical protein